MPVKSTRRKNPLRDLFGRKIKEPNAAAVALMKKAPPRPSFRPGHCPHFMVRWVDVKDPLTGKVKTTRRIQTVGHVDCLVGLRSIGDPPMFSPRIEFPHHRTGAPALARHQVVIKQRACHAPLRGDEKRVCLNKAVSGRTRCKVHGPGDSVRIRGNSTLRPLQPSQMPLLVGAADWIREPVA